MNTERCPARPQRVANKQNGAYTMLQAIFVVKMIEMDVVLIKQNKNNSKIK
jgi:hypothetical protein